MKVIFTSGLDLDKLEQDGIVKLPFDSLNKDRSILSLEIDGKVRTFDIFSKVGGNDFDLRKFDNDVVSVNLRKYSESFYEICSIDIKEESREIEPIPTHQEEKKECKCSGCPKASSGAAYKPKQFKF